MSEQPQQHDVPAVEKPSQTSENQNGEFEFLQQQAKSSTLREVVERQKHNDSNEKRLSVLQSKLDIAEAKIAELLPRNAELESSVRMSRVLVRDGTVVLAIAGILVGWASLVEQREYRYLIAGFGTAFLVLGLWICKIMNRNAFPSD